MKKVGSLELPSARPLILGEEDWAQHSYGVSELNLIIVSLFNPFAIPNIKLCTICVPNINIYKQFSV